MLPKLDKNKVPPVLHHLIPLAECFGIADDSERERRVKASSPEEIRALKAAVLQCDDEFDKWLVGPEVDSEYFSDEYIAFSAMRMAADYA